MHQFDLKNKTAIITGGAQGFGLDIAKNFLSFGAKVFIWDVDENELIKASKKINNSNLEYNLVDVSNFKNIENTVNKIAMNNKRVVVAGLEKDYLAKPFGFMPELLVNAEYITKVNAICMVCGDPANFSQRITSDKKQVLVGESDKYEARCRKCFLPK